MVKMSEHQVFNLFQKINFLRDLRSDHKELGRIYFPDVDLQNFSPLVKDKLEREIEADFNEALKGIRQLPVSSRNGVYLAYYYYSVLLKKIKQMPPQGLLTRRIRIPNFQKIILMIQSNFRHQLGLL